MRERERERERKRKRKSGRGRKGEREGSREGEREGKRQYGCLLQTWWSEQFVTKQILAFLFCLTKEV